MNGPVRFRVAPIALAWLGFAAMSADAQADRIAISEATKDAAGFAVHTVRSPYQSGTTKIRVLLPDKLEKGDRLSTVYLLPVEAKDESRYGDGLKEAQKLDLPNKLKAIVVAPTFSHLPWYADHPTDLEIRQETYFVKVVVPFVEKMYPARSEAGGRLLLGFSKSGWGAYSLLLRNPDLFGRAAAWDAPLAMDRPGLYGSGPIFGTPANFEKYRIAKLLKERADLMKKEKRLILVGYGNFRNEHVKAHDLMESLKIVHDYRDGPSRTHDWHGGWVAEAAELLTAGTNKAER